MEFPDEIGRVAGCGRSTGGVDQIFFPPLMWGESHTRLCRNSKKNMKAWGKIIVVVVVVVLFAMLPLSRFYFTFVCVFVVFQVQVKDERPARAGVILP